MEEEKFMKIYSENIVYENSVKPGTICIKNGKIKKICPGKERDAVDYTRMKILPGIIDTHNHGGFGVRINDGCTKEEMDFFLQAEASYGVTSMFATTYQLQGMKMAAYMANNPVKGTRILGINSEGPWGARVGEKGKNTGYSKIDIEYAKKMLLSSEGLLKVVSLAPEIPGALEMISFFKSQGITVSIYHTNATYQEARIGIDAGITLATHLGNVMSGLHHRDVGAFGACLLDPNVYCELICDGFHVCNEMLDLIFRIKENDKIIMISDNTQYAGVPVGRYKRLDVSIESDRRIIQVCEDGKILSLTGRLTGSSKPILYGIKNLVQNLGMPLEQAVSFASCNPARFYRLDSKGSIEEGKDADLVIINDEFQVIQTLIEGEVVYDFHDPSLTFNQSFINHYKID